MENYLTNPANIATDVDNFLGVLIDYTKQAEAEIRRRLGRMPTCSQSSIRK